MATKQRTLEEFFAQKTPEVIIPYLPREESWDQSVTPDGKIISQSPTAKIKFDPNTKKQEVSNAAIDVNAGVSAPQTYAPAAPTNTQQNMQAPTPTGTRQYVSPAVESETLKKKSVSYADYRKEPSAWERALVGATPLLVGLLTGNNLEGVSASADYFVKGEGDLYKRDFDLNKKLAEMQMKKEEALATGKANAKEFEYRGSDGINRLGRFINGQQYIDEVNDPLAPVNEKSAKPNYKNIFNPATEQYEVAEIMPGGQPRFLGKAEDKFAPNWQVKETLPVNEQGDPDVNSKYNDLKVLKNGMYFNTAGQTARESDKTAIREQGMNDRFKKMRVEQAVAKFMQPNSIYNKSKDAARGMVQAADLLNKNNPIANQNVKVFIARQFQSGVLSDQDLAQMQGSAAWDDRFNRLIEKYRTGDFQEGDADDLRQIIEVMHDYSKNKALKEFNFYSNGYDKDYPEVRSRLKGYVNLDDAGELPRYMRNAPGVRKDVPKSEAIYGNPGLKKGAIQEGYEFLGGDPAKKESWKKVK